MSIATRTGDDGTTGLMYNRRVLKTHPRIEACGAIDELNAALGMARAAAQHDFIRTTLLPIQSDLIVIMGELAALPEDLPRYHQDGYPETTEGLSEKLDRLVQEIEAQNARFKGWATPGASLSAASLDQARVICRRAERAVLRAHEAEGTTPNRAALIYLNRLSDVLWLMARWVERREELD